MGYTPKQIKNILKTVIAEVDENKEFFVKNPGKDFSRERKLPFSTMIYTILSMGGSDLKCELMDFFDFIPNTPSVSAFVQQRGKIKADTFETIFKNFTGRLSKRNTYRGYRLIAIDGSDLHTPTNPDEAEAFIPSKTEAKPFNMLHLNAMYDLKQNIYTDAIIQPIHQANEHKAFTEMVDRDPYSGPTIYIADRGYESYNNLAHVQEKGQYFLIRIKDFQRSGIAGNMKLSKSKTFEVTHTRLFTRKQTNAVKADSSLTYISHDKIFDYLPARSKKSIPIEPYALSFRIVRLEVTDGIYETLITNLPDDKFKEGELRELYAMRWGIETSFRSLKYTVGLIYYHSKKSEYICQDVFAKLTMYNFAELMMAYITLKEGKRKFSYKINFSAVVHICSTFLVKHISSNDVRSLILRYLVPVKPPTSNPRKMTQRTPVCFLYRAA